MEPKEQIREIVDVADLIAEYLTLKNAGQGAFKAVCPFHAEKTPSFYISRPKQIWHCFGCDKGGDIFSFVMEMEGVEFPEAMRILGKKAGVEIPVFERKDGDKKDRMMVLNGFAQKVYAKYLNAPSGKVAKDYIENRGIDGGLTEKFGIGYAPDAWTALLDMAVKKGANIRELQDAGLAIPSKGKSGAVDRFRHRLMIPLRDHHGNTVGFTGRVLRAEDNPKYMNSPQTQIYDKSSLLYGLFLAKTAIKKAREVVIVEGNLDVVASHKAGVENVVATSGTALTPQQLRLLKRYTQKLVFCFDADSAGFEAARRGMRLASTEGFDVRVVSMGEGDLKDPDDIVQKDPRLWVSLVEGHVSKMDFLFDRLVGKVDVNDVDQKARAGREFLPEINALKDPIKREHWLKRLSEAVDTPVSILRGEAVKKTEKMPYRDPEVAKVEQKAPLEKVDKLVELTLSMLLSPETEYARVAQHLDPALIPEGSYRNLYELSTIVYNSAKSSQKSLFEALRLKLTTDSQDLVGLLDRLGLVADQYRDTDASTLGDMTTFLMSLIDQLKDRDREKSRKTILAKLRLAERDQDAEKIDALTRQYQALL